MATLSAVIHRYLPEFYLTAIEIFVASLNGSNLLRNVDAIVVPINRNIARG